MDERGRLCIGGEWVESRRGGRIELENPGPERVIGGVPGGTAADINFAVSAARETFPAWAATSRDQRAELLHKLADGLGADAVAESMTAEVGTPIRIGREPLI